MPARRLLASTAPLTLAAAIAAFAFATPAAAQLPYVSGAYTETSRFAGPCGPICQIDIRVLTASSAKPGDLVFVRMDVKNTSNPFPPFPLTLQNAMGGSTLRLRVYDAAGTLAAETRGNWIDGGAGLVQGPDAPVILMGGQAGTFYARFDRALPASVSRTEIVMGDTVVGGASLTFPTPPPPVQTPAPPSPPANDGVVLAAEVAAPFKGIWFTGETYLRIMDAPNGRVKAIAFDTLGQELGAFRIDANRSTAGQLVGRLPNESQGDISLYPDGANGLTMIARGGGYDGSRGFRVVRVTEIGRSEPVLTESQIAEGLKGRWNTPFGVLTFALEGGRFIGAIPANGSEQALKFDALAGQDKPANQSLRFNWGNGTSTESDQRVTLTPTVDGFIATSLDYSIRGQREWRGSRLAAEAPQPPAPQPQPPGTPPGGPAPLPGPVGPVGQWSVAAYQAWAGTWWFGGEYITFEIKDDELSGAWFAAGANGRKHTIFQIDLAKSNPNHLGGVTTALYQSAVTDVGLTLSADGQTAMMLGGDPAKPFGGLLRKVSAVGERPAVPTTPDLMNRLVGSWETPKGRVQFTQTERPVHINSLLGTFATDPEKRMLFRAGTSGDSPTLADAEIDSVPMSWFTQNGPVRQPGLLRMTLSPDGRSLTLIPVSGPSIFGPGVHTIRRTGAPAEQPRPLPPTQPEPQPAPPTPEPTPPVTEPAPPVPDPTPPVVEPTPPVVDPAPPVLDPSPPVTEPAPPVVEPAPPMSQPTPPVVQPTPPATPQPQPPQPQPPTPVPPGAGGGSSIGAQGGYQGISQTWDVKFDGARVERDSEVHVFMSVKNRSTSDQYVTPGTFIPNLGNQDGEVITSRAVFRASGEKPTEFRPTVPADGEVRVRFIFRPEAGTAQPQAFTLESFGHRKLTFDVSALRVGSLAQ